MGREAGRQADGRWVVMQPRGRLMSTIQVRPPGRVRLTVEEFARIQDFLGLFEGRHVQLLDGELYEVTKNPLRTTSRSRPWPGPHTMWGGTVLASASG